MKSGKFSEALLSQQRMLPLIDALFCETNPAPVKWLMHSLGLIENEIRLPLTEPRPENKHLINERYGEYLKYQ
jgi:4-hydroxy-tetrahydrodipicolinate synthase